MIEILEDDLLAPDGFRLMYGPIFFISFMKFTPGCLAVICTIWVFKFFVARDFVVGFIIRILVDSFPSSGFFLQRLDLTFVRGLSCPPPQRPGDVATI